MNLAINVINETSNELKKAFDVYQKLTSDLNELMKVVGDFYLARQIDKNDLLQQFQGQVTSQNNFNYSKKFFSDMQFQKGTSVCICETEKIKNSEMKRPS